VRHKRVRTAKLFYLDRTPFVVVSATLFTVFVFALMLTNGLPRFGPSDLPKVNNPIWAADAYDDDAIVLVVVQNGRVFWRQHPISIDDLRDELRHRLEHNPKAQIFVAVDTHASYGSVAPVLAALRLVGAERIVFLVDQRKPWTSLINSQPDFWNLGQLWRTMDWLSRVDFMLLSIYVGKFGCNPLFPPISLQCRSKSLPFLHP
jgi:biopolymer transport protein ExbD